jgi:uncharacterized protein
MLCPVCQITLLMTTREGVEIDYCPQCRGVWLDRGELDKLIELEKQRFSFAQVNNQNNQNNQNSQFNPGYVVGPNPNNVRMGHPSQQPQNSTQNSTQNNDYYGQHKPKKKEGFLDDLFDFF